MFWVCLFVFHIKQVLSTTSVISSSIILLSSVQVYKHLREGNIISYLLFWFLQVPPCHTKTGLKSSYQLETKQRYSAQDSQLLKVLPGSGESLPKYTGMLSSESLALLCNI